MRKWLVLGVAAILALALTGCGGGTRPVFVAQILSDQPTDGNILYDPVLDIYQVTQGPNTLFFGIDDNDPNFPEYRAFLDFPRDGSTGGDVVPANAEIVSATVEVFINQVSFAGTVPTLVYLVTYSISGLQEADFNSSPLQYPGGAFASASFDLFDFDQGNYVAIDVTLLMREAQRRGLADFQLRFLLDFTTTFGFVGIDDRPTVSLTAPLLIVEYR